MGKDLGPSRAAAFVVSALHEIIPGARVIHGGATAGAAVTVKVGRKRDKMGISGV